MLILFVVLTGFISDCLTIVRLCLFLVTSTDCCQLPLQIISNRDTIVSLCSKPSGHCRMRCYYVKEKSSYSDREKEGNEAI